MTLCILTSGIVLSRTHAYIITTVTLLGLSIAYRVMNISKDESINSALKFVQFNCLGYCVNGVLKQWPLCAVELSTITIQ